MWWQRLLAPFALGATLLVFLIAGLSPEPLEGPAFILLFSMRTVVAASLTGLLFRFERLSTPLWRIHLRQCALLYVAGALGWLMQGEGLTARGGEELSWGASAIVLGQTLFSVIAWMRTGVEAAT